MGMKFTLHAHGIPLLGNVFFKKFYLVDNKIDTKIIPKGRFPKDLLYFLK